MKSCRILLPCGLLILCGLVDWSHSHPAICLDGAVEESMAKNVEDNDKYGEAKTVFADVNSGKTVHPSQKLDTFETSAQPAARPPKTAEDSRDFKSLAGDDARGSQTTFLGKIRTFFSSWLIKFWEKIKCWSSKVNFFKSKDEKVTNPPKDAKVTQPKYEERPVLNQSPVKGPPNEPTPSEDSKDGIPPPPPTDSMGGSKVASHASGPKNRNNPNTMPEPAPARKGDTNTHSKEGIQGFSSTAPKKLPRLQTARSGSSSAKDRKPLIIKKPDNLELVGVIPNNQLTINTISKETNPSHTLTMVAAERHEKALQDAEMNKQDHSALSAVGDTDKPIWQNNQMSYQVFPHGHDGSGTEFASLATQKIEVVKDPVTNKKALRFSAAISHSVVHGGPGHLQNLAALETGSHGSIPAHAIDTQEDLLKRAGKKNLPWNVPSFTSDQSPETNPIFITGNDFTPRQTRPMEQNFQEDWGSSPSVPSTKRKAYLEEIEDDPPQ
ncbi:secreted protein [Melampsora americana]|nr:secreted protein [Melampsora americana]